MTDGRIALRELLEKGPDATVLSEVIGFAAERLMALGTGTLCGAGPGPRGAGRTVEPVDPLCGLAPKLRHGSYFPGFLAPRRMAGGR